MKKRICIDIRVCQKSSRYTGVGIYAFHLSKFLEFSKSEFEFWYIVLKNKKLPWDIPPERLIILKRPSKPESLQEIFDLFDLKYILKKNNISIYHSLVPGMMTPSKSFFVITTIHDVIPDIIPSENFKSIHQRLLYKIKMFFSLKSNHIITDSVATKNDFLKLYDFQNKITSIYLSSQFSYDIDLSITKKRHKIHENKYLLYLGGFNYRKNVSMVIKSFANIANDFPKVDLLIIGKPTENQLCELISVIEKYKHVKNRVIFKGFIPDSDLPDYYKNCEAFIYPSLYEGFGIPVLEAMQCLAPVITSDRGSIPEVIGLSGIIVNPESLIDLSKAISNILSNSNLQNQLRQSGFEQSKLFSWEKNAFETLKIYRNLLNISL